MGLDPISIGLAVAGGAMKVGGDIVSGNAKSESAMYQSQVAANNAKTATQNAEWTMQAGETAAANEGMKTAAVIGRQKAAQAANNIDVNSGSAADVRSSTDALGMLDALTIRSNAARQAYGYQVQSQNFSTESALKAKEAKAAKTEELFDVGGDLLSTASTVNKQYSAWQQNNPTASAPSSVGPPMNLVPVFGAGNGSFVSDEFSGSFA